MKNKQNFSIDTKLGVIGGLSIFTDNNHDVGYL